MEGENTPHRGGHISQGPRGGVSSQRRLPLCHRCRTVYDDLSDISMALFLLGWSCGLTGHFSDKMASFREAPAGHVVGLLRTAYQQVTCTLFREGRGKIRRSSIWKTFLERWQCDATILRHSFRNTGERGSPCAKPRSLVAPRGATPGCSWNPSLG